MGKEMSSRVPGFHNLTVEQRRRLLAAWLESDEAEVAGLLDSGGLRLEVADRLSENVLGRYSLPFSVASNFQVNGEDVFIPMVCEEPSVVAAASNAARLARAGGGFRVEVGDSLMTCQLQLFCSDCRQARSRLENERQRLLEIANRVDPTLVSLGGGAVDLQVRHLQAEEGEAFLVLHLLVDVLDAMGANAVNSMGEALAPEIERVSGGRVGLVILTNRLDHRQAEARVNIPAAALAFGDYSGERVRDGIVAASRFAEADPYRAATHNKGILNGVGALALATGNDWRALEAAAHAHAARDGRYRPLATWRTDRQGRLAGVLRLPLPLGCVGGATGAHPTARLALRIMKCSTARRLAALAAACGLASNLAALRALSTEGIQRGHMRLHRRALAAAGHPGDRKDARCQSR